MAVELDHPFSTTKPIDESFASILDLERVVPCVEGGSVLETTGPNAVRAQIKVKMGAMSMTFTGSVEILEQDSATRRVVMGVKSKEAGGQGHANANVVFALTDGGGTIHTNAQITGGGASMATITMRRVRDGEVPPDGGTAIQEDPDRPVFNGNGPDDYVCVKCGNLLATAMSPVQMTKKVRVRCGRCSTVNVSVIDGYEAAAKPS